MNYEFEQIGDLLKVSLDGRLVAAYADEFQNQTLERLGNSRNVLLDLSKMTHVDSSGLGAMVFILRKMIDAGGTVKIACLQDRPRIIFEITKVFRVFEIFDSVDEALKSFDAQKK